MTRSPSSADPSLAPTRAEFVCQYPLRWQEALAAWQRHSPDRRMWLMYAANYLFATRNVRWAIDPLLPNHWLPGFPADLPMAPLAQLSFVLLTHDHGDHADHPLLASLRNTGVRLVVPEAMLDAIRTRTHMADRQLVVARHGQRLELDGVGVVPFAGWHWETTPEGSRTGLDATGYLVEIEGQRWLFPGDVRAYGSDALAPFAPVDCLFAHLWLGRGAALLPQPPLLEAFGRFLAAAQPKRVILSHLYEFSRGPEDLWTHRHADLFQARWQSLAPGVPVQVPEVGQEVVL